MNLTIRQSLNNLKNSFNDAYIIAQRQGNQQRITGIEKKFKELNKIFPAIFNEIETVEGFKIIKDNGNYKSAL